MKQQRKETLQRASFRMLRRLGQVIKELHRLNAAESESSSQIQRITSQLVCNAVDIAEQFSGLPGWEDRLAFIRSAGIDVSQEMYEGFAEVYSDQENA